MFETIENWDYCQVEYQLLDGGQEFSEMNAAGRKVMWFQFHVCADGPKGDYIAGQSEKIPLANMMGAPQYALKKRTWAMSTRCKSLSKT